MLEKYKIIKKLGSGGTSTVYLAEHRILHSLRVIKCIKKKKDQNALQEARILSQLHHSRIPLLYDWEEDEERIYLVMEYYDGQSLNSYIRTQKEVNEERILQFSLQICEVIHYLHSQKNSILYLDLKPDNILVSGQGIKIIDFGCAVFKNDVPTMQKMVGTIGYAAPEQYNGCQIDERTDLYGIGMVMYYMVTGEMIRPDKVIPSISWKTHCSRRLGEIIERCIQENPRMRYGSIDQLQLALAKLQKKLRKKQGCKRKTSLTIAVAGTQHKVGTTHVALTLSKYCKKYMGKTLYVECNDQHHAEQIINWKGNFTLQEGVYVSPCLHLLPRASLPMDAMNQYAIQIREYGIICNENIQEFQSAQIRILVTMGKPWELKSGTSLFPAGGYNGLTLVNLVSSREFMEICQKENRKQMVRLPYLPEVLIPHYDRTIWNLLQRILEDELQRLESEQGKRDVVSENTTLER
ncbi:serine/threonine protein kinase [Anaerosporobacter faecicola]|uniref:serine/threonine protein kinase n=1 Tax=Anaerosporobacter faecicola TaxID=2718714 RepID=UPI00143A7D95|nr:serine/threonine-protein kinase [Anaerosporobacter faecicola]